MRWDGLFADLEAQMGGELEAEERALQADEIRVDRGRRDLASRIADLGVLGEVSMRLVDGSRVTVRPEAAGEGWIGATLSAGRRRVLIPVSAIVTASSRGPAAGARPAGLAAPRVPDRTALGMRVMLRDLARRRQAVDLATTAVSLHGTIDAVAGDHLELAVHAPGVPRRAREVTAVELIPLAAILTVAY